MRQVAGVLALLLMGPSSQTLSPTLAREAIDAVLYYRHIILEDRTPVDFCAIPEFWDGRGRFIGSSDNAMFSTAVDRSQCAKTREANAPRTVTANELHISGDTLFVYSTTRREGFGFWECYVLTGLQHGSLRKRQYRVLAMIAS